MKRLCAGALIFWVLFSNNINAQPANWQWGKAINAQLANNILNISPVVNQCFYITGTFYGPNIIFGNDTLSQSGNASTSLFVTRYDQSGNPKWAKEADGGSLGVSSDNLGNAYVVGQGWDTTKFGIDTLFSGGTYFIAKYDTLGRIVWVKGASNLGAGATAGGVCSDLNNNIYVTGSYEGLVIFDHDTVNGIGAFLIKYDNSGKIKWMRSAGIPYGSNINAFSVSADSSKNIYISGRFNSRSLIFGNDTLNNPLLKNRIFIAKYDSSGNVIWARALQGIPQTEFGNISTTHDGNVYMAGVYDSTGIILGNDTLRDSSTYNYFIAKFNTEGEVLWGQNQKIQSRYVTTDIYGNAYLEGGGYDSVSGVYYAAVAKYNNNGNIIWTEIAPAINGAYDEDIGISCASVDSNGNIYMQGFILGLLNADTGVIVGTDTLTYPTSEIGSFIAKIGQCIIPQEPSASTYTGHDTLCAGNNTILTGAGIGTLSWYSADTGGVDLGAGTSYITPNLSQSTTYYLQDSTCGGVSNRTSINIVVNSKPNPVINQTGFDTLNTGIFASYQWLYNNSLLDSASDPNYIATQNGNYQVVVTNSTGCRDTSAIYQFINTGIISFGNPKSCAVYPNPNNGSFILNTHNTIGAEFSIYGLAGNLLLKQSIVNEKEYVNLNGFSSGVYYLQVSEANESYIQKIIITQ